MRIWKSIKDWMRENDFFSIDHLMVCLIVALLCILLGWLSLNLSLFSPVKRAFDDFAMTDVYYEMHSRPDKEMNNDIVLVDMTELVSRGEIADVIDSINACEPKVLLVDLIFQHETEHPLDDAKIAEVEGRVKNGVFSCKLTDYSESKKQFSNVVYSFFKDYASNVDWAYSNVHEKRAAGCVREFSLSQNSVDGPMYSIPYLAACKYRDIKPTQADYNMRIIVFDDTDFPEVNHKDVMKNKNILKGKIVLLGTMHEEADMHITPIGKMPGMKLQAYSIISYMEHPNVRVMSLKWSLILAFIVSYLSAWMGLMLKRKFPNTYLHVIKVYYFMLAALLVWAGFICFMKFDYNIQLLYPLLAAALVEESRHLYKWLISYLSSHNKLKIAKKSVYAVK